MDMRRLASENLLDQIVNHEAIAPGEGTDETGKVGTVAHGKRGKLQAGDPAFGARLQSRDVGGRERQPHARGKKRRGLLRSEA